MALILNIDTSIETASLCLSQNGEPISTTENREQKDHAAWLHVQIKKIMNDTGHAINDLQAVALANGPGSYTGLRVGMAAAKGLCYALKIPFITVNTLYLMASAVRATVDLSADSLICPMIDARRMEVYTAIYSSELKELLPPSAIILNKNSFENYFSHNPVVFVGSGASKWREIDPAPNSSYVQTPPLALQLGTLSHNKYLMQDFTDLIYSEPAYLKEFFTHEKK